MRMVHHNDEGGFHHSAASWPGDWVTGGGSSVQYVEADCPLDYCI